MKCKNTLFFGLRMCFVFALSFIAAIFLLAIAFLTPVSSMMSNAEKSYITIKDEGRYFNLIKGEQKTDFDGFTLDNFTDSLMIDEAITVKSDISVWQMISMNYHKGWGIDGLGKHFEDDSSANLEYARYWHGYLVFLKPLLLIFDISGIRILNLVLQLLLVGTVMFLLMKKHKRLLIPYILSLIFINPFVISKSLQFSSVYYIMNLSLLFMLLFFEKLQKKGYLFLFFMGIGIAISFFDLLTAPIATLCVPLVFVLFANSQKSLKEKVLILFKLAISWCVGYFGFWLLKWVFVSAMLGENFVVKAFEQVLYRVGEDAGYQSGFGIRLLSITLNFGLFFNWKNLVALVLFVAYFVYFVAKHKRDIVFDWKICLPYLLVAIIPLGWNFVLGNHTFMHYWFTFRGFIGIVFAIFVMLIDSCKNKIQIEKVL